MNKYKTQINVISKNESLYMQEKIDALSSLLKDFEEKYANLDYKIDNNYLVNSEKRSRFYWCQMVVTVLAGIVTMATATKSLETTDLMTINNLICAVSGTITAAGIGSMVLEEMGVPIVKEDREINELRKIGFACIEIKNILEKLQKENQSQPQ